ncbi:MAG: DNA lyase [Candidatus Omnitrophota bacterium]
MRSKGVLLKGSRSQLRKFLNKVRFPNNKAEYIFLARKIFKDGLKICIKNKINPKDIFATRDWFVKNVKGIGYKEASHFLRNIGYGQELAILDVHILRCLKKDGVIDEIPSSISRKKYLEIEKKVFDYAVSKNASMEALDLQLWAQETGFVFK